MPRPAILAVVAILVLPRAGVGQDRLTDHSGFYLGMNALVGGGAAVAYALTAPDGPPLGEAFVKGALGGAVMYGGQRMVGSDVAALRLPGVQTVALGANLARNAGAGVPLLDDLTFPLYPLYVRVRPHAQHPVGVRVSAVGAVALGWALASNGAFDATVDWKESLLTGAPVFRSAAAWVYPHGAPPDPACTHGDACDGAAAGVHRLGTSWYTTGGRSPAQSRRIIAHETIHLTQLVRDALLFGVPAGDAAMHGAGGILARAADFVAVDAFLPLAATNHGLSLTMPAADDGSWRIYEFEARTLSGTR